MYPKMFRSALSPWLFFVGAAARASRSSAARLPATSPFIVHRDRGAMNFTSGGTIEGTISSTPPAPAPPSGQPPKPPGIPEHYIFDEEVELWMPPSAIAKAAAHALVPLL